MFDVHAQLSNITLPQDLLRRAGAKLLEKEPTRKFEVFCEPVSADGKPYWAMDNYRLNGRVEGTPSHLFYTQPGWGSYFEGRYGRTKIKLVTYACDPELHNYIPGEKIYDVGFIGQLHDIHGERQNYLEALKAKFNCYISDETPSHEIAKKLSQCKVLFNHIRYEEVNIRFFESLALGTQVCSYSPALHVYATEGEDFLTFKSIPEAMQKIEGLLGDNDRIERMRLSARTKALNNTYTHRAKEMLQFVS